MNEMYVLLKYPKNFEEEESILENILSFFNIKDLIGRFSIVSKLFFTTIDTVICCRRTFLNEEEVEFLLNPPFPPQQVYCLLIECYLIRPVFFGRLLKTLAHNGMVEALCDCFRKSSIKMLQRLFKMMCKQGNTEIVRLFSVCGRLDPTDKGYEALKSALTHNHVPCACAIFDSGRLNNHEIFLLAGELGNPEFLEHIIRVSEKKKFKFQKFPFKELFYDVVEAGKTDLVSILVRYHSECKMDSRKSWGFRVACRKGYTDMVKLFIHNCITIKINPAAKLNEGLITSIRRGHLEIVNILLGEKRVQDHFLDTVVDVREYGVDSPHLQKNGNYGLFKWTSIDYAFFLACELGFGEIIKKISGVGSVNIDVIKYTQQHFTSKSGNSDFLKQLLMTENVDPDGIRKSFIQACEKGKKEIIEFLLTRFSEDLNFNVFEKGFEKSCYFGTVEIMRFLLEVKGHGLLENRGHFCLIKAIEREHLEVIKELVKFESVDVSFSNHLAIVKAARTGRLDIISTLLQHPKIDPSANNNECLNIVIRNRTTNFKILKVLLKDVRVDPSYNDNIAIILSTQNKNWRLTCMLLKDQRVSPDEGLVQMMMDGTHLYLLRRLFFSKRINEEKLVENANKYLFIGTRPMRYQKKTLYWILQFDRFLHLIVKTYRERIRYVQDYDLLDLHKIEILNSDHFTLIYMHLGFFCLAQLFEIPVVIKKPIVVKQIIIEDMIFARLRDSDIYEKYFKNREFSYIHYYVFFDELELCEHKRAVCVNILNYVTDLDHLFSMFYFYISKIKGENYFEKNLTSIFGDYFLFTFFNIIFEGYFHIKKERPLSNEEMHDRFYLKKLEMEKERKEFMRHHISKFLKTWRKDNFFLEVYDENILEHRNDERKTKVLLRIKRRRKDLFYIRRKDYEYFNDERFTKYMKKKYFGSSKARKLNPVLNFHKIFQLTLARLHFMNFSTSYRNCRIICFKKQRLTNRIKRHIVNVNLVPIVLRSNFFHRMLEFGLGVVESLQNVDRELTIPFEVMDYRALCSFLDFLFYGIIFDDDITTMVKLLVFSWKYREYELRFYMLDRLERMFFSGFKNESHKQLIVDIGYIFAKENFPKPILSSFEEFWSQEFGISENEVFSLFLRSKRYFSRSRNTKGIFFPNYTRLIKPIVVIDTEGVLSYVSGRGKYKRTTYWCKKIAAVKYYPTTEKREEFISVVKFPLKFDEIDRKLKGHWSGSQKIHGLNWDTEGDSPDEAIRKTREFIGDCTIFAKGVYLEVRFLNDIGLFGVGGCTGDINMKSLEFQVNELGHWNVRKFPGAFHDPLEECFYFLEEFLMEIGRRQKISNEVKKSDKGRGNKLGRE